MSEATCGGAQRNHTSVAGGEFSEGQKPLKSKDLSRRPIPLQSRESPVRIDPGDSLLFENFFSLRHLLLYVRPLIFECAPPATEVLLRRTTLRLRLRSLTAHPSDPGRC